MGGDQQHDCPLMIAMISFAKMAQIIVRKLEDEVLRRLREEAAREGVSTEEEARRILRRSLLKEKPDMSFKEFLLTMPDIEDDSIFERPPSKPRDVEL